MNDWIRQWVKSVLAGVIVLGAAGCEGDDQELGTAVPSRVANQTPAGAPAVNGQGRGAGASNSGEAQVSTPARSIDTKQLTDIVKDEVNGGESTDGPSPFDYLWLPSRKELISDEPLTVKVPLGLQPLTLKAVVPVANPLTKGKVRAGKAALFRPQGVARRHGQLCDVSQPGTRLDRRNAACRPGSPARPEAGALPA